MKQEKNKIIENKRLAQGIYKLTLETDDCGFSAPGQFAMVKIDEKFLRRPISVCNYDSGRYTLVYKTVGQGTEILSKKLAGSDLDVLTGLGNGYDVDAIPDGAFLIGGGIGIPPLYGLLNALTVRGKSCSVVLGFNSVREAFLVDKFQELSDDVRVVSVDGSIGDAGMTTDAFRRAEYACVCGPPAMLRAINDKVDAGQFSLETRMGCGFGACMGCSIITTDGFKRVCKDGPVFDKEIILW